MLRVIIADDEDRICQLIDVLADWQALDMEVIGTAHNGVDALALVQRHTPDVLITDIRMPGMTGLALIRRAKEHLPALAVIIISGYAQFDYAQTAIQYGVGDYLLKPINKEALNSTLGKIGEACRARMETEENIQQLRESSIDGRDRMRQSLPDALLQGTFAAADAQAMADQYAYAPRHSRYQAFLLKLDYPVEQFTPNSLEIVYQKARAVFEPLLASHAGDFVIGAREALLLGVMDTDPAAQHDVRKCLREGLNELVAQESLFGEVSFTLALGTAVASPAALPTSVENARRLLGDRLLEGTGRMLEGETEPSGVQNQVLLARYAQEILRAIDVLGVREAGDAVDALRDAAIAQPGIRGWELFQLAWDAGVLFITRLGVEDRQQALAQYRLRLEQAAQVEALFECLRRWQAALLDAERERRVTRDEQPIRMAKQYIQRHFAEPVTLEEVSAAIGFSPNYFSTMFKKETGEGFAKYLAHVRMDEARNLLRETRLSVAEVCKRAGYGDIKHFTRAFRAENGLTPGEYRKLYG